MKDGPTLLNRIYRLKVVIIALASLGTGIALLTVAKYSEHRPGWDWLSFWPISEIGGTLTAAGLFGIAWDYVDGKDKEAREDERIRRLLKESAPDFRDAVISGFAETPDNMRGVATTETLDKLATNALALRLGDEKFAAEIYEGLLAQAIRTPERWEDVDVSIRLSSIEERSASGAPRSTAQAPLYEVTVTWDYTLIPSSRVQKFACVSDRDEFRELLNEIPATSTWFLSPRTGFAPSDLAAYELLTFTVNGEERPIRRSQSKTRQTYSIDLGDAVGAGHRVKIRHTLRTVITREGHWLQVAMTQPTKNLSLTLDYTDTDIARLQVTDLVSSAKQPWVTYLPQQQPSKIASLEVPGWLLPQAQVTFIWTREDESTASAA